MISQPITIVDRLANPDFYEGWRIDYFKATGTMPAVRNSCPVCHKPIYTTVADKKRGKIIKCKEHEGNNDE